jgi:hypothetical protein
LDDPKARAIAIADNRTAEIGLEWDPDILGQLSADLDLKTFFTDEEIQEITGLSDGSTDTDRLHLTSDYQIIDAAFEH